MGKTYRKKSPHIELGDHLSHKQHKSGKVRDGTATHYSKSCEHHGGCPYCESNRKHSSNRRKPIEE